MTKTEDYPKLSCYQQDMYHLQRKLVLVERDLELQIKRTKYNAHLRNRCLMAFNEILFNHNADAVVLPESQIKVIRKLIKDLQP